MRSWRAIEIRKKGAPLGTVAAPDATAAIKLAIGSCTLPWLTILM
jgi:hypothetical protein